MPSIFVSYRRDDSEMWVHGALRPVLETAFPQHRVFVDLAIEAGREFGKAIEEAIRESEVVLVVVGPRWATERLHDDEDWVHAEIRLAIEAQRALIPVLIANASMPTAAELPVDIAAFTSFHASEVAPRTASRDMEALVHAVRNKLEPDSLPTTPVSVSPLASARLGATFDSPFVGTEVRIPAGQHSSRHWPDPVSVASLFVMAAPVTRFQWQTVMGPKATGNPRQPVQATWADAVRFCVGLSLQANLEPAYAVAGDIVEWHKDAPGYRLPTDAEWEYACRAGTQTPTFWGADDITLFVDERLGNPVGALRPNPWGLHDMISSCYEWCWTPSTHAEQPHQPDEQKLKPQYRRQLVRGGGGVVDPRSEHRAEVPSHADHTNARRRYNPIGFRCVRNA